MKENEELISKFALVEFGNFLCDFFNNWEGTFENFNDVSFSFHFLPDD